VLWRCRFVADSIKPYEIDGIPGPKTQAAFARFANALINSGF
jgi:hypothetical protein